jgi:exportin-2 (importin alpha re-exporter)
VAISNSKEDKGALQRYFTTLRLLVEIFYDLSSQDIPPFAEENLTAISTLLHRYLAYDNPLLHTDDDSESGILDEVKVAIFEVLVLYVQKYEEFFGPFVGQFVETSWTLLTTTGIETKHDILVSKALQFLSSIARLEKQAENFNSEQVLGQVIEGVILPNVTLRESDMELFEDEPIEFIRRDLEGSDNDTRRRAATDFLRQLLERFEKLVTDVTGRYINHYLSEYAANKTSAWKSKDTAVYLFSAIAAKGAVTSGQGVQTLNP